MTGDRDSTSGERWQRIEQLYHAALERDATERAAFLADACSGDEALREEVESLLAHAPSVRGFLSAPALEVAAKIPVADLVPVPPGRRIGARYRLAEHIGEGGMGVVYRAIDESLEREVAIKFLPVDLENDAERVRRFTNEAHAASALNHPHILTLYEAGEFDGRPYLVTEFVDGGTLRDWARSENRTWRQVVELLIGVADGLAAAHQAGILHRDIKPENILVARNGYAKLADFGLAALQRPPVSRVDRPLMPHTRPGTILGTVAYMSPEQASGTRSDARSDIYSFGVVLYELLAGRRPSSGATDLDVMHAIVHDAPEPLGEWIPAALRTVTDKALEKDPGERYQSARDLVVDLRRLIRPTDEHRQPAVGRTPRTWMWATALTAALIAIAVAGWSLRSKIVGDTRRQSIRSIAVLPLRNLSASADQQYFADGVTEALTTGRSQISALNVISRTSAMRYQGTSKSASEIGRELHVDGLVEGAVQRSGRRVVITAQLVEASTDHTLWAGSYERDLTDALPLQKQLAQVIAGEIQVKLTPQERMRLADAHPVDPDAQEAYLRGRYWRRLGNFQKALEYDQQAIQKDPGYALACTVVGLDYSMLINSGRLPAKETYPKWRGAVTRALELDDTLAEAHSSLGGLLEYHDWNWKDAEREFKRAIELNPNLAGAHLQYSDCLASMGRLDEAVVEARRARQLDPYFTVGGYMVGYILVLAGRIDEAIEQGRSLVESSPPEGHTILGLAYGQQQDWPRAIAELQQAVKSGSGTFDTGLASLGYAYGASGGRREALQVLANLEDASKQRFVPSWSFALVYTGLGDVDRAFAFLQNGYDERPSDIAELKVDPRMAPLRSDPRYRELLQRMGLSE